MIFTNSCFEGRHRDVGDEQKAYDRAGDISVVGDVGRIREKSC